MRHQLTLAVTLGILTGGMAFHLQAESAGPLQPTVRFINPSANDQDDACLWVHPEDTSQSVVITSDKSANKVFVYTLDGSLLQEVSVPKPGNIDLRQNISLGEQNLDLVVVNQRTAGTRLVAFQVDPTSRTLVRLDKTPLTTGPNYGGALGYDKQHQRTYFISTSETGQVEQFEFIQDENHGLMSRKVRDIPIGKCEGAVVDDASQTIFITEEDLGIWSLPLDPNTTTQPKLIARIGQYGLQGDLEGITCVHRKEASPLLIVSDQGRSRYVVFEMGAELVHRGEFSIAGAESTDGIDIVPLNLGPKFPHGVFLCHTDVAPRSILGTPWDAICRQLGLK